MATFNINNLKRFYFYALTSAFLSFSGSAYSQFKVDISGIGLTQIPIAIVAFQGEKGSPQKISSIIQADLERSGQFRSIDTAQVNLNEISRPDVAHWSQQGADSLVAGSISRLADGRYDIRFRLWDVIRGEDLGGLSYAVTPAELRLVAHRVADFIYEKLTKEKSVFSTKISYVTKVGKRYQLWVADADGENALSALTSSEPIISPVWSPSGDQLAYVSFESRKPVIYTHNVATAKRRLLANFRGSNSAPAWSPNGKILAVTLSRDGGSQLYTIAANGGDAKSLAQSSSIDTEPVFTPDGKNIFFVSDRGGSPQIYKMESLGGNPTRVTFSGTYNVSPAISPDGRLMAYISRVMGAYQLNLMELSSGITTLLTETAEDESPSFAPNGRLIVYATKKEGVESLMTTTLDGKIKARLTGQRGNIREPDWGPFQN